MEPEDRADAYTFARRSCRAVLEAHCRMLAAVERTRIDRADLERIGEKLEEARKWLILAEEVSRD